MKNKLIIIAFLVVTISSCTVPRYLPSSKEINVNEFGSFIQVFKPGPDFKGELIAVDSTTLVILTVKKGLKNNVRVQIKDIDGFTLKYAKTGEYGRVIPLFSLVTITHGFFLILTAPINGGITESINNSTKQYRTRELTYEQLKMFARFPQGIPSTIEISSIE